VKFYSATEQNKSNFDNEIATPQMEIRYYSTISGLANILFM